MRTRSSTLALAAAVAAAGCAVSSPAEATPTTCGGPGEVTIKGGPTAAIGKPCSIPFKVGSQTFNGCVSVNVVKPAVTASVRPFKSTDYWCATTPTYSTASKTTEKEWGFCGCEYEVAHGGGSVTPTSSSSTGAPTSAAPTTINTVSTQVPTLAPSSGGSTFQTSGGYVAENSPCWFPLVVNGQTFSACVPISSAKPTNKGKAGSGTPPSNPKTGGTTAWCYTTGAPSNGTAINYSALPKATQVSWGYCRSVAPTTQPTTVAPSTAPPTASIPVTTGGYAKNATKCTIPFVYKNAAGTKTTINSCASYSQFTPYVNNKNPPAQPQPPFTNATWCYTGVTGVSYDPTTKNAQWGFCAVAATAPPSPTAATTAPSPGATTVAPTSGAPSTAPSVGATTVAPSATQVPSVPATNATTTAPTPIVTVPVTTAPSAGATTVPSTAVTQAPTTPTLSVSPTAAPVIRPSAKPSNKGSASASAVASGAAAVAAAGVAVFVAALA